MNLMKVGDRICVTAFSDSLIVLCDMYTVLSCNAVFIKEFESGLLRRVQGVTALHDAVAKAISCLANSAETRRCKPEIVVITDGEDNNSV